MRSSKQKRLYSTAFVTVLFAAGSLLAQNLPTPAQIVDLARKASDLSKIGPFTLTASVVFNPTDKDRRQEGTLRLYRDGSNRRIELQAGNYKEVRTETPGSDYVVTDQAVLFLTGLGQLERGWDLEAVGPSAASKLKRVAKGKKGDQDAVCVKRPSSDDKYQLCFDPVRSVLVSRNAADTEMGIMGQRRTQYSNFGSISGVLYPAQAEILTSGIDIVVSDIKIVSGIPDGSVFSPFPGAFRIETCDREKGPDIIATPTFVNGVKPDGTLTNVSGSSRILLDDRGRIVDIQTLGSAGGGLSKEMKEALKQWHFTPARCGDHSVASEVVLSF